jgi:ATP-dependent Lon protease
MTKDSLDNKKKSNKKKSLNKKETIIGQNINNDTNLTNKTNSTNSINSTTVTSDTSEEDLIKKNVSKINTNENNQEKLNDNFESIINSLMKELDNKNPWFSNEPIILKAPIDIFFNKIPTTVNDKVTKNTDIDIASATGNLSKLEDWLHVSLIEDDTFNPNHNNDYTSEALDNASINNKKDVLEWWHMMHITYNIPLKYTEKALNGASKAGNLDILNWWFLSNLELKYNEHAVNNACITNKIDVLNWWFNKHKEKKIDFKYSQYAMDKCRLDEKDLIELLKWWKDKIDNNGLVFLYGKEFIDCITNWNYTEAIKYLTDNKMLSDDSLKKKPAKRMGLNNLFEIFGSSKKESSSKVDTSTLPKDIQDHIKEKEEELNNNMMINGKAKEYIDNLVKIPFGKYKEEKIFKFLKDLIQLINDNYKVTLKNESDIIEFLNSKDTTKDIYNSLYKKFCEYRISYLEYVDSVLDSSVYGHERTKKQFKCIIAQWLSGGNQKGIVIGIQGPPGVGKTTIIKGALAKCLVDFIDYDLKATEPWIKISEDNNNSKRPFCFISLGGSTNSSTLIGHNITYHGATSGDIVKCLKEAKYMNPIIYFDELDKISKTEHGNEISSVLTHITDPAQNEHFTDRYFSEVKIDLSRCIVVFSYNDASKIDRILYDRIQEIKLQAIPLLEKIEICKRFLIPEILENMGYNNNDLILKDNELENLILSYTYEAGVRKIKEKLNEILRNHHLNRLTKNETIVKEVNINNDYIDTVLNDHHKMLLKKITSKPAIGCIHGMYATTNGLGDIMLVQVKKMYNKDLLGLHTTGSLEKVITESIQVARTVAWNLLTEDERKDVETKFTNTGLHIHCPDGSTPKDGPSAGTAITTAIYSLLTNKLIKNDLAITGEIDLDGNVTAIGGLDAKLSGAKRAGIKLALVPLENKRDVEILLNKNKTLVDNKFKVKFISHIDEVLKIAFKNK